MTQCLYAASFVLFRAVAQFIIWSVLEDLRYIEVFIPLLWSRSMSMSRNASFFLFSSSSGVNCIDGNVLFRRCWAFSTAVRLAITNVSSIYRIHIFGLICGRVICSNFRMTIYAIMFEIGDPFLAVHKSYRWIWNGYTSIVSKAVAAIPWVIAFAPIAHLWHSLPFLDT